MNDEQNASRTATGNGATDLTVNRRSILLGGTALAAAAATLATAPSTGPALAQPAGSKPNILFIMGDDIGWFNVSAYNMGIMGYRTPNIDRIGREGAVFTDWYGQQSCTAGRAAFITGQSPIRTGLTKVGLPGAALGLGPDDPSVADVMKSLGYATGQFGKNHLGDRNEHLPTVHGFDEFFGNLYHLNAEEEPENSDYPKDPSFRARFGPRGVLKCKASDTDDPTVDPAFGKVGKQVIENTGPLDTKRMETVDEEFLAAAKDFIQRQHTAGKPWFCYFNSTRMHIFTHLKKQSQGKIAGDRLDAHAFARCGHPDLAVDGDIGRDDAKWVPGLVCPDEDALAGRPDEFLLPFRIEPVLFDVVVIGGLFLHRAPTSPQ